MLQFLLPTAVSVSRLVAAVLSRRDRETQPVTAGCIHVKDCHVITDGWWGGCSLSAQSEAHKLLRAVSCSHSILSSIHSGWKIKMQLTKSCPQSRRHYAQLPSISRAPESSAVRKKEPMDGSPLTTCLVISSRYCITGKSRFEPLAGSAVWIMPFMRVFQEAPCETFITDRDAVLLASTITVGSLRALK